MPGGRHRRSRSRGSTRKCAVAECDSLAWRGGSYCPQHKNELTGSTDSPALPEAARKSAAAGGPVPALAGAAEPAPPPPGREPAAAGAGAAAAGPHNYAADVGTIRMRPGRSARDYPTLRPGRAKGHHGSLRRPARKAAAAAAAPPASAAEPAPPSAPALAASASASEPRDAPPSPVTRIVLKVTTLAEERQRAFPVGTAGATVGRAPTNGVVITGDPHMADGVHARVAFRDGVFWLEDAGGPKGVSVRLSPEARSGSKSGGGGGATKARGGQQQQRWALTEGAVFSCGGLAFEVHEVGEPGALRLDIVEGKLRGQTVPVSTAGVTIGRSNDNDVHAGDGELSRRHARVAYDARDGLFYLHDVGSTNGSYVRLVGPHAGPYPLALGDHLLVARTGFAVNRFDYCTHEDIGVRRTMEDRDVVVQDLRVRGLPLVPQSYFGVYDGHGGTQCSAYLAQHLHKNVAEELQRVALSRRLVAPVPVAEADEVLAAALSRAFVRTDADFIKSSQHAQAGSTATTAVLLGRRLYAANVGDSRVVLSRAGRAVELTEDHKPWREDELERIKAAGGCVFQRRVMGELAVSRAFGDVEFKQVGGSSGGGGGGGGDEDAAYFSAPLVIAKPEFRILDLTDEDEFLLLACDGLYDVYRSQEAVDFVRAAMANGGEDNLGRVAQQLVHSAIHQRGSRDNVTVIIVRLDGGAHVADSAAAVVGDALDEVVSLPPREVVSVVCGDGNGDGGGGGGAGAAAALAAAFEAPEGAVQEGWTTFGQS